MAQIGDKGEEFGDPARRLRAESLDLFRQARDRYYCMDGWVSALLRA